MGMYAICVFLLIRTKFSHSLAIVVVDIPGVYGTHSLTNFSLTFWRVHFFVLLACLSCDIVRTTFGVTAHLPMHVVTHTPHWRTPSVYRMDACV
jgi:hypothetical protein